MNTFQLGIFTQLRTLLSRFVIGPWFECVNPPSHMGKHLHHGPSFVQHFVLTNVNPIVFLFDSNRILIVPFAISHKLECHCKLTQIRTDQVCHVPPLLFPLKENLS